MNESRVQESNNFRPNGAILFFGLLLLLTVVLWFTFYYIMIVKGS